MNRKLKNIIAKLEGRVLIIGFDDVDLTDCINNNTNIIDCDSLNLNNKAKENGKLGKTVNIKKLRKIYKKKKLDYIIVNMEAVEKYSKYFIKDSIYICKQKIYVFGANKDFIKYYKRYDVEVASKKLKDSNLFEINAIKSKNNIILDNFYFIYDIVTELLDKIGDVLTS